MNIPSPSGYWLQPMQAPDEVLTQLAELSVTRPFEPFDGLDESMPIESLRVAVQVGIELLARLAGVQVGDYLTADLANRGLLAYVTQREAERKALQEEFDALLDEGRP